MTQDHENLVSSVNQAQRRVLDTTPHTIEWRDAQRDAVLARADFWHAMRFDWDRMHPKATPAAATESEVPSSEFPASARLASWFERESARYARPSVSPTATRLVASAGPAGGRPTRPATSGRARTLIGI